MSLTLVADPIPLARDADGVIRVGRTRVTLDTVVHAFRDGFSAEAIVEQYPTLRLADVYAVLGYYLDRQAEVEEYLRARQATAGAVRQQNEATFDPNGLRARLLARQSRTAP